MPAAPGQGGSSWDTRLDNALTSVDGKTVRLSDWLDAVLDGNVGPRECRTSATTDKAVCGAMLHQADILGAARLGEPIGTFGGQDYSIDGALIAGHQLFQRGWPLLAPEHRAPNDLIMNKFGSAAANARSVGKSFAPLPSTR